MVHPYVTGETKEADRLPRTPVRFELSLSGGEEGKADYAWTAFSSLTLAVPFEPSSKIPRFTYVVWSR